MGFDFLSGKKHLSCFLVTIQTPDGVFYRIVDEKSFSVGRSLECGLSFPDPNISRVHIVIAAKKDQVWLIDQGSANGTYVNGEKAMANKMSLIQPTDNIKLGSSDIHLKVDLFEKNYKQDELVNSLLPDNEKNNLMEVIQGAHQQAKRIILQAQEHYDKLIKSAELKVRNVENSLLIKQDEIISAANVQANQVIQEGKKKSAQIVFDGEQKALDATKEIFKKAEDTRAQADQYYQGRLEESQKKSDEMIRTHMQMGQKMIQEASEKSQEIRKSLIEEGEIQKQKFVKEGQDLLSLAHQDGERLKEQYIENAKVEMKSRLADLINEVDSARDQLTAMEKKKEFRIEEIEGEIRVIYSKKEEKARQAALEIEKLQTKIGEASIEVDRRVQEIWDKKNKVEAEAEEEIKRIWERKAEAEKQVAIEVDLVWQKKAHAEQQVEKEKSKLEEKLKGHQVAMEREVEKIKASKAFAEVEVEKEMELYREKRIKQVEVDVETERQRLDFSLSDLKSEIQRIQEVKTEELKKKQIEFDSLSKRQDLELKRNAEQKELELRRKLEDLTFNISRQERELERLAELRGREIKAKEEELSLLTQRQMEEIENHRIKAESELKLKLDSEFTAKKREMSETEQGLAALQEQVNVFKEKAKEAQQVSQQEIQALEKVKKEVAAFETKKAATEEAYDDLLKQIQGFELEKKKSTDRVKELEQKSGQLQMQIESQKRSTEELAREHEVRVKEHKNKLEIEFGALRKEKEKQFQDSLKAETENAQQVRAHLLQEIEAKQSVIIKDIHNKFLKILASQGLKEKLADLGELTMRQIKASFDENVASLSTSNQTSKIDASDVRRKQDQMKFRWMASGLAVGLGLMAGYHFWSETVKNKTLASIAAEKQKEAETLKAQRKFDPPKTFEVRNTYTDSVIYTKDFVALYESNEIRDRWVRQASDYLFKNWRIDESRSVELLSLAKTLVKSLEEKKEKIHPDFVDKNIEKMREFEEEQLAKMKEILGTEVKFQAYKRFEKKFFMNELARRAPAETYYDPGTGASSSGESEE